MPFLKCLLERVEILRLGESLDSHQACTIRLDRKHYTGANSVTAHEDRAGPTHSMFASDMRACKGQLIA
jgi:hypothetical protein